MKIEISHDTIKGIADYFSNKPNVLAIFLLGSAARGELRKESDIDLAILPFNGKEISSLDLFKMVGDLGYSFGYDFDLGVMSSKNLVYAKEAIFHGKRIHTKDEVANQFRVNDLLSMYYNFQIERQEVINAYRI
jgi:uncharacterized protein